MKTMKTTKKILIAAVLICGIFYLTYRIGSIMIADFFLKDFLKAELIEMLEKGSLSIEDLYRSLIGKNSPIDTDTRHNHAPGNPDQTDDPARGDSPDDPSSDHAARQEQGKQATPPDNQISDAEKKAAVEQRANEIADQISDSDKQDITKMILSKLSADDISYLLGLLGGGLTTQEKQNAAALARSRFSEQELVRIKGYYQKYIGLVEKE